MPDFCSQFSAGNFLFISSSILDDDEVFGENSIGEFCL